MKTMKKYQTGAAVKGSKGAKASQIIAGISAVAAGAAGIGKNISNRRKAKKAAEEKAKMEAAGKMKYGGAKKPLRKAQYGTVQKTYQGPLNKSDIERLDAGAPSTATQIPYAPKEANLIRGLNPFINGQMISNEEREAMERIDSENYMRKPKKVYKKEGGPMKKRLMKAQDGKIIKSKKVRTASMNTFGPSTANVSKTKRDGSTITKSVDTNQGYVPFASKTKSITDASGNTTSSTKDMDWNKAVKKQYRMAKRVGRNPNDEISINQKGGAQKSLKKAQYGTEFGKSTTKKNIFGRTKVTTPETGNYREGSTSKGSSTNTYDSKGNYVKNKTKFTTTNPDGNSQTMVIKKKKGPVHSFGKVRKGIIPVKKTGGMVNSNTKVTALKSAGSKGVKSGVNSKVSASKVAKGRTGGTSSAPKTATPKAKMGGSMKKKSC
jgi:hypothetical protein